MRLSHVTFLHQEHILWVDEATSEAEMNRRRKIVCKVRAEMREYVELGDTKRWSQNEVSVDSETGPAFKPTSLKYMESFVEALRADVPRKQFRKAKSFPGIF